MLITLLIVLVTRCVCHAEVLVTFEGDAEVKTDQGFATLRWQTKEERPSGIAFELQRGHSSGFEDAAVIYRGGDQASVVSGLPEGTTWYRVRAIQDQAPAGPWSPALSVEVTYVSANFVTVWMIVGAVVFIATVTVIMGGHWRTRNQAIA